MEVPMQDVAGMVGVPGRNRWMRARPVGERRRVASFVAPALAATVMAALILHLLTELALFLPLADPLGALSVLGGMSAVLVTLMPFTVLWARRAHRAWASGWPAPERRRMN